MLWCKSERRKYATTSACATALPTCLTSAGIPQLMSFGNRLTPDHADILSRELGRSSAVGCPDAALHHIPLPVGWLIRRLCDRRIACTRCPPERRWTLVLRTVGFVRLRPISTASRRRSPLGRSTVRGWLRVVVGATRFRRRNPRAVPSLHVAQRPAPPNRWSERPAVRSACLSSCFSTLRRTCSARMLNTIPTNPSAVHPRIAS